MAGEIATRDSGSKPECNVELAKPRVALAPRELAWTIPQPRNAPFDSAADRVDFPLQGFAIERLDGQVCEERDAGV